jgi:hypothetical protein
MTEAGHREWPARPLSSSHPSAWRMRRRSNRPRNSWKDTRMEAPRCRAHSVRGRACLPCSRCGGAGGDRDWPDAHDHGHHLR